MKKFLLVMVMAAMSAVSYAQAGFDGGYLNAQARIPQIYVQPIVKPLVAEIEVLKDGSYTTRYADPSVKHKFVIKLTKRVVEQNLRGNVEDIHNFGVYMLTDDIHCDMLVAPTYNLYSNNEDGYTLEIKGFPANYKTWRTADSTDYDWMKINGALDLSKQPSVFEKKENEGR